MSRVRPTGRMTLTAVVLTVAFTLAVALLSALAARVAAHGELTLELGAERIQPGGAVEVRGDLGSGEQFEIALISKADGSRRPIAIVPATDEGHFQSYVTVPTDVTPGEYLVEASFDLLVVRAPLTIAGAPLGAEGEGPDQADGLARPMPSAVGQDRPAAGASAAAASAPSAVAPPGDATGRVGRSPAEGLLVVGAAVAGAAILMGGLRLGRRPPRSSP